MMGNTLVSVLKNKNIREIKVLVVAESQRQRQAFSDTVRSCGFTLVNCVSRDEIKYKPRHSQVDIWLIDSDYDEHVATAITASKSSTVLVGFSEAPYLSEVEHYVKWQRKLKRKLAQILEMPTLMQATNYNSSPEPWRYVVFLAASMGGPSAVKEFLDNVSPDLPICILLAHHFNPIMIESLPRILNRHNKWRCQIINTTQRLQTGVCMIAPIHQKIVCDSTGRIILEDHDWTGEYKPAIGQLLKNTSDVYGSDLISIVFSGMGHDGTQYLDTIQDNHSQLWAQDPKLSTCSSQPQAIIDSGYCHFIGSPKALAQRLTSYVSEMTEDSNIL